MQIWQLDFAKRVLHQLCGGGRSAVQRTCKKEPTRLVLLQLPREVCAVAVHDCLASLQQRNLQVEILQDLDECVFKTRNFEAIFYTANETDGTDFNANILKQSTDEGCEYRDKYDG
jgi:hypothetical protein